MTVPVGMRQIRREDDYETRWIVVGPLGAIDFHCTNIDALTRMGLPRRERVGGVEFHRPTPETYQDQVKPDHESCWILGGRCWHDGTSLWASEYWVPLLERDGERAIWDALHVEYRRRFSQ